MIHIYILYMMYVNYKENKQKNRIYFDVTHI